MMMEEEPIAEEDMTMEEEPIADEDMMMEEEEPIADEDVLEEAPVVEESVEGDDTEVAEEEIDTREFTIAELTGNSDVFKTLAAALDAAELTEILGGEGPFTVFAPTDDAFAELPEGALDQLLLPENKEVLIQILTYHVVPGAILSGDLESGSVATVEGSDLTVEVDDTVTVNNANVLVADVEASNGVIHIIDRVILPPAPAAAADADSTEVDQ
ncbi:MAG: fasciclin domain-containing protein [Phormidesmis sp. RL_2_1]|nr:fasciclin domain-containing protein [Phormidesmis sp. RL_2_1]